MAFEERCPPQYSRDNYHRFRTNNNKHRYPSTPAMKHLYHKNTNILTTNINNGNHGFKSSKTTNANQYYKPDANKYDHYRHRGDTDINCNDMSYLSENNLKKLNKSQSHHSHAPKWKQQQWNDENKGSYNDNHSNIYDEDDDINQEYQHRNNHQRNIKQSKHMNDRHQQEIVANIEPNNNNNNQHHYIDDHHTHKIEPNIEHNMKQNNNEYHDVDKHEIEGNIATSNNHNNNNDYGKHEDIQYAFDQLEDLTKSLDILTKSIANIGSENEIMKKRVECLQENTIYSPKHNKNLYSENKAQQNTETTMSKMPKHRLLGRKRKYNDVIQNKNDSHYNQNKRRRTQQSFKHFSG